MDTKKQSAASAILTVIFLLMLPVISIAQEVSFSSSGLLNENLNNPTSLDFGPDGRLYVSQQDGQILAFNIIREGGGPGEGTYSVTATEIIDAVQINTPNHTDDGIVTTIKLRQVTGIHTAGSASNPVLYVTSSDNLIGGGGGVNDKNLDTNSGVISKLTWNGSAWTKVDLVRGLPRCEENHSINGMDLFEKNGETFILVQQGGHSNKGAPSNNFVGTPEYFLSGALLIVNLTQLESMPVYTDPRSNTQYVYDMPTLNDPEREDIDNSDSRFPYPSGHPLFGAIVDVGDPFGGNDGLNQAFAETGGPVQIFSTGYRNAYDVIIAENGNIFTSDNGPNTGWGGLPLIYNAEGELKGIQSNVSYSPEEGDYITNEFSEAGSGGHGDPLHYVGTINDPNGTYYAGHPIPILAFPSRADLINYKIIDGEWTETARFTLAETLPGTSGYFNASFSIENFPDDARYGNYISDAISSDEVNILDIVNSSTNGIAEYTASNFEGALKGDILTASFNGNINRYKVNENGELISKEVIFNGFGATPLDVIALPDDHPFAGTVWAATYGADNITVFEPSDLNCSGINDPDFDPQEDNDNDGYNNQDEIDNGTNFCSGGSTPKDNDGDLVSDLNDSDDDNDSIADVNDVFAIDPDNGTTTNLPVFHPFWNNDPGTGFFGLGFTGLMLDPEGSTDYLTQFDENNISFGGAAGKASIDLVPKGDAIGSSNSQQYGFQFGVNVDNASPTFTIHSRVESPFFGIDGNSTDPLPYQAVGIFAGNGDQNNYLKVVLSYGIFSDDDVDGVEILLEEEGGVVTKPRFDVPGLLDGNAVDIFINITPSSNLAQVYVSSDGGLTPIALGNPITLPESFLDPSNDTGMAVGLLATSNGSGTVPFSAIWDFINITEDQPGVIQTSAVNDALDFGDQTLDGNIAQLNLEIKNLSGPADEPLVISDLIITGEHAELFASALNLPVTLGPGGEVVIPLSFSPTGDVGEKFASLQITHSGQDSPLIIPLTAVVEEQFDPLLRINAGGAFVAATDGGPDWLSDTVASAAFTINTGNLAAFDFDFANKDESIPDYIDEVTFVALFGSERWDAASGAEMAYSIPLPDGKYVVNLYAGNGFPGTATTGSRIFDVLIENDLAYDELDLSATFGHQVGGLLSYDISVSDGELNIEFVHGVENPLINAIEILAPPGTVQDLSLAPIDNRVEEIGTIVDFAVAASGGNPSVNYSFSIEGQPDGIAIEPTNGHIFGAITAAALDGGIAHDGVHTVTVTLNQSGFGSVTQEFQWTVTEKTLTWIDKDENLNYIARHECSFVHAGNKFIMFGGRESAEQLDVYDYASDTWSPGGEAPVEFNHFQATTYQGLVWVIGAFKDNSFPNETPAENIYMYNPDTEAWIQGPEIPESRRRGGAGLVMHDDKFYVLGGNTVGHNGGYVSWFDVYDPATGEWAALTDAPHARDHFHATIADGKLYAVGGRLSGGEGGVFAPLVPEVDVYDFSTQSWSTLSTTLNLPTPRAAPGIATFDERIFVMGGEGESPGPAYDIVEIFDPIEGAWSDGPTMNYARHGTQAIVSGEGIFIAGGSPNRGGGNQKNMEVLGEDNPQGIPIIASDLDISPSVVNFEYDVADGTAEFEFSLSATAGNAGIFIQSITVSGENYSLLGDYSKRLLSVGSELQVAVQLTDTLPASASGVATVNFDNGQSIDIPLNGTRGGTEVVAYRINAGGAEFNDSLASWSEDLNTAPSIYVNSDNENRTYTVVNANVSNATGYDSELFSSTRFNRFGSPNNMQWNFPVDNGSYIVNLLFAEIWSGAASPGVRVFDVAIENTTVLEAFDMTATYGWNTAGIESFYAEISDGALDIDFVKILQNPHVNGIEIIRID